MRWSQMNNSQRAFLRNGAKFKTIMVNGRVVGHEPLNALADVMAAAYKLDRDHDIAKERAAEISMAQALASFTPQELSALATKIPAGRAAIYGTLQRKKATAMPMRYYARTGLGV